MVQISNLSPLGFEPRHLHVTQFILPSELRCPLALFDFHKYKASNLQNIQPLSFSMHAVLFNIPFENII